MFFDPVYFFFRMLGIRIQFNRLKPWVIMQSLTILGNKEQKKGKFLYRILNLAIYALNYAPSYAIYLQVLI